MAQLQVNISAETAARLQQKADDLNLSASKCVEKLLQKELMIQEKLNINEELARENGWPEGFFDLYGCSKDAPIERPDQGEFQNARGDAVDIFTK